MIAVSGTTRGIGYIVLAFFFVALMGAITKYANGIDLAIVVFFQSFIALVIIFPWSVRHGFECLKTKRFSLHFVRAGAGLGSQILLFLAVRRMPLMNAVLLANAAPIFINVIFWFWFHEKTTAAAWFGLALGFVGIILVLKPTSQLLLNSASLIALSSAVLSAVVLVMVDRLTKTEGSRQLLTFYFFISSALSLPFVSLRWQQPTAAQWLYLFLIGLSMAAAQLLIVLAYRQASAKRISPFNYTVVLFSGLLGRFIFKDRPDSLALAGTALVVIGGVLSLKYGGSSLTLNSKLNRKVRAHV